MIDIHSHILPGVDDGATDIPHALAIARLAVADGTTHIFATPHTVLPKPLNREQVKERVAELQAALDEADIPLTVYPGHEIHLHANTMFEWKNNLVGPLNDSHYLLAEPSFTYYGERTNAILFELIDKGYTPIIAHPERIGPLQKDLSLLEPALKRGALLQITGLSLLDSPHTRHRQAAETLLRQGMVHIIASDAHNTRSRPPGLNRATAAAATFVGESAAQAMVTIHPHRVVNNLPWR